MVANKVISKAMGTEVPPKVVAARKAISEMNAPSM